VPSRRMRANEGDAGAIVVMIAGYLVYVRNHFGGLDPEKPPLDMPHVGRPDNRVEWCYALTTAEFTLPITELEKRYPAPEPQGQRHEGVNPEK
jgi:hypothetical protein